MFSQNDPQTGSSEIPMFYDRPPEHRLSPPLPGYPSLARPIHDVPAQLPGYLTDFGQNFWPDRPYYDGPPPIRQVYPEGPQIGRWDRPGPWSPPQPLAWSEGRETADPPYDPTCPAKDHTFNISGEPPAQISRFRTPQRPMPDHYSPPHNHYSPRDHWSPPRSHYSPTRNHYSPPPDCHAPLRDHYSPPHFAGDRYRPPQHALPRYPYLNPRSDSYRPQYDDDASSWSPYGDDSHTNRYEGRLNDDLYTSHPPRSPSPPRRGRRRARTRIRERSLSPASSSIYSPTTARIHSPTMNARWRARGGEDSPSSPVTKLRGGDLDKSWRAPSVGRRSRSHSSTSSVPGLSRSSDANKQNNHIAPISPAAESRVLAWNRSRQIRSAKRRRSHSPSSSISDFSGPPGSTRRKFPRRRRARFGKRKGNAKKSSANRQPPKHTRLMSPGQSFNDVNDLASQDLPGLRGFAPTRMQRSGRLIGTSRSRSRSPTAEPPGLNAHAMGTIKSSVSSSAASASKGSIPTATPLRSPEPSPIPRESQKVSDEESDMDMSAPPSPIREVSVLDVPQSPKVSRLTPDDSITVALLSPITEVKFLRSPSPDGSDMDMSPPPSPRLRSPSLDKILEQDRPDTETSSHLVSTPASPSSELPVEEPVTFSLPDIQELPATHKSASIALYYAEEESDMEMSLPGSPAPHSVSITTEELPTVHVSEHLPSLIPPIERPLASPKEPPQNEAATGQPLPIVDEVKSISPQIVSTEIGPASQVVSIEVAATSDFTATDAEEEEVVSQIVSTEEEAVSQPELLEDVSVQEVMITEMARVDEPMQVEQTEVETSSAVLEPVFKKALEGPSVDITVMEAAKEAPEIVVAEMEQVPVTSPMATIEERIHLLDGVGCATTIPHLNMQSPQLPVPAVDDSEMVSDMDAKLTLSASVPEALESAIEIGASQQDKQIEDHVAVADNVMPAEERLSTDEDAPEVPAGNSLTEPLRVVVMTRLRCDRQTKMERVQPVLLANLAIAEPPLTDSHLSSNALIHSVYEGQRLLSRDEVHSRTRPSLQILFAQRQATLSEKVQRLREEYLVLHERWLAHCSKLDEAAKATALEEAAATAGRTTRRSAALGDAVRTDLEMEQIIASLGNEELTDANHLAARNAAVIPDMISVTHGSVDYVFDDTNNAVDNPAEFYAPTSGVDDWTEEEKAIFIDKYALYPKQFGLISDFLPYKSPAQCITYYYLHKKTLIDFRKVISRHTNGKRKRGGGRRTDKKKGNALLTDIRKHDDEISRDSTPTGPVTRRRRGAAAHAAAAESKRPALSRRSTMQFEESPLSTPTPDPEPQPDSRRRRRTTKPTVRAAVATDQDADDEPADLEQGRPAKRGRKTRKMKSAENVVSPVVPEETPMMYSETRFIDQTELTSRKKATPGSVHWSEEDKDLFLDLLSQHGADFKRIAASMPNKTTIQVSAFYRANVANLGLVRVANSAPKRSPTPDGPSEWKETSLPGSGMFTPSTATSTPPPGGPLPAHVVGIETQFRLNDPATFRQRTIERHVTPPEMHATSFIPSNPTGLVASSSNGLRFHLPPMEGILTQQYGTQHDGEMGMLAALGPIPSHMTVPFELMPHALGIPPGQTQATMTSTFPSSFAYSNLSPSHFVGEQRMPSRPPPVRGLTPPSAPSSATMTFDASVFTQQAWSFQPYAPSMTGPDMPTALQTTEDLVAYLEHRTRFAGERPSDDFM
ncbi:uncharacterized protein FIBRA_06572 [Fibroporia radiculosa]|uniref:SANT domain-containing protein n=1 Tax=Fibroporia radiculosa TaxID=599839 RepID=J4IBC0_9APHY|nr:uncharacterized protein FIBRA_06572 [Fibroporia radiculosa]CCM04396.1 predicted protein [Fibroporia radiculosa]